jgi:hypothetical protein
MLTEEQIKTVATDMVKVYGESQFIAMSFLSGFGPDASRIDISDAIGGGLLIKPHGPISKWRDEPLLIVIEGETLPASVMNRAQLHALVDLWLDKQP